MSDEKSQLDEIPPHKLRLGVFNQNIFLISITFGMTDYILMHRNALEFSKILIELRLIKLRSL